MRAGTPRPPWGWARRTPRRGHLKSQAAAFKGAAGAGRLLCTADRAMPHRGPRVAAAAAAVTVAGGDRRDVRAEWGRGGPRRGAWTPGRRRRGARARAPSPRRHTKMSAGEKINPCVAAAALPLRSSLLPSAPRAAAATAEEAAARAALLF